MHEFSLISALMETVLESAEQNRISKVTRVKLIVGEFHGALPEVLSFAFEALAADTVCSSAELDMEIKKGLLRCTHCGHEFSNAFFINRCPVCGARDVDILAGRELHIDYYEGE
ncbi:hydrogenase nickel incorporation protein HypA/HybF [Desulfotomaculum arcticum]|uniref:Hydrogenase maturation factor HypA n=1 Tax=Desulfotruncus arcticus DSM 17038 TaxID=1121424 RepID=A0A1I2YR00_9FIRM|nr:hydrogenase maturation nickel metallochaperone HypA [Desulfotruncus arcticus]SFH28037.1 hydrogenase nickel incorporation protein HypA/HybF [Desulfotomaculum arcticum] [Desulfotruncus arcticus DSM 17038]